MAKLTKKVVCGKKEGAYLRKWQTVVGHETYGLKAPEIFTFGAAIPNRVALSFIHFLPATAAFK